MASKVTDKKRDKGADFSGTDGGDSIPASVLQELRSRFTRSAETARAYAELYNQKGEEKLSERNSGMAFAYGVAVQGIAEELDRLGIPREGEKQE